MFDFMDLETEVAEWTGSADSYIPAASECMRCGLCVSACPTHGLFQTEEETPRRRIRGIEKLINGQTLGADETFHLQNCLLCRACETACPSKMPFGKLFDQIQPQITAALGLLAKLALWLIEAKRIRSKLMLLPAIYLKLGLPKLFRNGKLLNKLGLAAAEALLTPPALKPLAACYPATGTFQGRVALFTGCIAEHFDRDTLTAAIRLLNAIGYEVLVPAAQACCGAIHQHNGFSAESLIADNIKAFNALEVNAVVHTATGCGAMLAEYPGEDRDSENFRARLADINAFLLEHWPQELQLKPSSLTVAVHEPCTQRNVLKNPQATYELLAKIPGLNQQALPDNQLCCGAGGSYMLTHPENAQGIRNMKRQVIENTQADIIVSANFACARFIAGGNIEVVHPLTILAGHLP